MTAKELETIVVRHEMQQLELKESFGAETVETACAFANAHGEFRITFSARTRESVAKLGIPPEKFGIGLADEVAENESEVAKKVAETKAKVAENVSAAEMRIIECIVEAPSMSQAAIAERLGMTRQYIGRCMDDLQKRLIIRRIGPKKGGRWEMVFAE